MSIHLQSRQSNGERVAGANIYVTLEPCSHHGRTPPCCEALIDAGVARVVMAVQDPNPLVSGRGAARLRAAGIMVEEGPLAHESRELNIGFSSRMERGRPWVRLKAAISLDGRTAPLERAEPVDHRRGRAHRRACVAQAGRRDFDRGGDRARRRSAAGCAAGADGAAAASGDRGFEAADAAIGADSCAAGAGADLCRRGVGFVAGGARSRRCRDRLRPGNIGQGRSRRHTRGLGAARHQRTACRSRAQAQRLVCARGLVDEVLVYMAPSLLGIGQELAAFGPLDRLDQGVALRFESVTAIGAEMRIIARPILSA